MTSAESPSTNASRPLGLWSATALVVGSMIGSGVFLLPASLAPYGAASLIGWGVTLCGALLLALTFVRRIRFDKLPSRGLFDVRGRVVRQLRDALREELTSTRQRVHAAYETSEHSE